MEIESNKPFWKSAVEEECEPLTLEKMQAAFDSVRAQQDLPNQPLPHTHADQHSPDFDGPVHSHPGYPLHDHG